ncbi:LysR family transcriptional regulator [Undibacterium sp. RuRC25W]|uniref:LysR family transcriptional regulator n=1 Tax=Undibacterium sp. RuRC25W TaxID=3413047 RepID=UPI003BF44053
MDLRKLRHAVVLSEELNFARAAQKVNLTQSALSRSIQGLEEELGGKLFDRTLHGVSITPIGRQVIQRAKALLLEANNLLHDIHQMQHHEMGDVHFGVGPLPGSTFLPPVLAQLLSEYPKLRTEVNINNWDALLLQLVDEQLEFFIADVHNITADSKIQVQRFSRQYGGFFCRSGHPLAGPKIADPQRIFDYPLVSVRLPAEVKTALHHFFRLPAQQAFELSLTCDNPTLLHYVCLHSDSILLSTYPVVRAEIECGSMCEITMPDQIEVYAEMGIVTLAGRSLSPAATWLIERIRQYIEAVVPTSP